MAEGVESANVVGYNSKALTTGSFNIVAVPFENANGTDGFKLNAGGFTASAPVASTTYDSADQVQIWLASEGKYNIYYYRSASAGWCKYGTRSTKFESDYPNGLPAGSTFWYLSQTNSKTLTTTGSGAIDDAATETVADICAGTFNLFSTPYPVQLKLNDTTQVAFSGSTASTTYDSADQVQIWLPTEGKYNIYYYRSASAGWCKYGTRSTKFESDYPNGMDVGEGFWYLSNGTTSPTVTFKSPITK